MTRKEEIENKLLELIEHVKDAPKKEALAAVGLDMAEWADKTMIERMELLLIDNLKEIPMGNGKFKIKAECSLEDFIERFRKVMEE